MADSLERPKKTKKFGKSFQYKTKYNTTWFSQENLKNHKDVITNSKFGEFYVHFNNKICVKDVLCIHDIANDLVRHYSENDIINDNAKIGVLEDLEIKIFFAAQPWCAPLQEVLKRKSLPLKNFCTLTGLKMAETSNLVFSKT